MSIKNKLPFIEIDSSQFTIRPFEVKPLEGYEPAINDTTKEMFPYCCNFHKSIYEQCLTRFETDKTKELSLKVVTLVSYTEHCIEKNKNNEQGLIIIKDYLQYCFKSFGHPNIGASEYLNSIKHYIEKVVHNDKKEPLLNYIEITYFTPSKKAPISLTALKQIYENWLNLFPFDISYFSELKKHFISQLPLIKGKIHTNQFTGISEVEMLSEDELLNFIKDQTVKLLQLVREHPIEIEDKDQHIFELLNQAHQLKQDRLLNGYSKKEDDYIAILEQWLNNEKEYFKEANQIFKTELKKPKISNPTKFEDIFIEEDFIKYIELLKNATPKLIDKNLKFIGSKRKSKGVICSWIKELQTKGLVYQRYNRRQLAAVLNNEIKELNIGVDGKTLDNVSNTFEKVYEKQLFPSD